MYKRNRVLLFFAFIFAFLSSSVHADWIDEVIKKERPDAFNSIDVQYPRLTAWLTKLIQDMEVVVNESLPEGSKKKLKKLYLYHSSGNGGPASLRKNRE